MDILSSPLTQIKGIGPKTAQLFDKKGLRTFEDALYFLPRSYQDRTQVVSIRSVVPGVTALVRGRVENVREIRRGRIGRLEITFSDDGVRFTGVWFRYAPYLSKGFQVGMTFFLWGEFKPYSGTLSVVHPEFDPAPDALQEEGGGEIPGARIVAVYSETEGLTQKSLRRLVGEALKQSLGVLKESLPAPILNRHNLPALAESFSHLHFPLEIPDPVVPSPYLKRLIFEEFFVLQLGLALRRRKQSFVRAPRMKDEKESLSAFVKGLPFQLTRDQGAVLKEVIADMGRDIPMSRLLQGDVGSGKTVVAFGSAVVAAAVGYQTALMAPTEILAEQHYRNAKKWLEPLGVRVGLLTQGSQDRAAVEAGAKSGEISVVIGTHTLFQKATGFKKLGLVVVDEQHRFGVDQRAELLRKGGETTPHLLMMSATPIPRTLALTLYGDMDLSFLREKPAGRKPILTEVLRGAERPRLYQRMRETVKAGQQVYVIYPLVEASEKLDLKSATEMHGRLSKEVFPGVPVGLLHGRMKSEEKEKILQQFRDGKLKILVSTTVIEVGIDVANATLMVIEHPERLGLSQLHQLRGRVGRGEKESYCILMAESGVGRRLRVLANSEDGFEIAEADLKIRGPGEFLGTRQSGLPGFRVGHLVRDGELLSTAREEALRILDADPALEMPEHEQIRALVELRWGKRISRLGE